MNQDSVHNELAQLRKAIIEDLRQVKVDTINELKKLEDAQLRLVSGLNQLRDDHHHLAGRVDGVIDRIREQTNWLDRKEVTQ